jgi:ubiquinone/menaquinone biosynthesis C-methylase UbiE/DNA-binding transcriptional ArsR family regulator
MKAIDRPEIFDHMSLLVDGTRGRILLVLEQQELTVSEICTILQSPQSTVSRHLKALADLGWVLSRGEGTRHLYRLMIDALEADIRDLWLLARKQLEGTPSAAQDGRRLASVLALRRRRSREFFDSSADRWNIMRDEMFGPGAYLPALLGLLDPEMVVADLGCGTGSITAALAPMVRKVIAIDASEAMLRASERRLEAYGNVEQHCADLETLPLEDCSLDAATLILVLHHLPDPARVISEVARVLKPRGRLLIVDMLPHERAEYRQEMGHVWMGFDDKRIKDYFEAAGLQPMLYHALPPDTTAKGPALFAATAIRSSR